MQHANLENEGTQTTTRLLLPKQNNEMALAFHIDLPSCARRFDQERGCRRWLWSHLSILGPTRLVLSQIFSQRPPWAGLVPHHFRPTSQLHRLVCALNVSEVPALVLRMPSLLPLPLSALSSQHDELSALVGIEGVKITSKVSLVFQLAL